MIGRHLLDQRRRCARQTSGRKTGLSRGERGARVGRRIRKKGAKNESCISNARINSSSFLLLSDERI